MYSMWTVYTGDPTKATVEDTHSVGTPDIITHLSQYGHLLCTLCKSVIPFKTLYHHLRFYHHIRSSFCQAIIEEYKNLPISQTDSDVTPLPDGTPPMQCLAAPVQGYYCKHCTYLGINWGNYRWHVNKAHRMGGVKIQRDSVACYLQQWVSFRKIGKYWRVDATLPYSGSATEHSRSDLELLGQGCDDPEIAALLRMEAEEEARLVGEIQGSTALTDELEHDENTD